MAIQNRRDQVLAYRFLLRRRHASLLAGDPDSVEAPLRKLGAATFASVMVATLAVAGAGVYGVMNPGNATSWKDGTAIIIEKETSTKLYYDKNANVLRPVLNYSSARLLMGQSGWKTVSVSKASLDNVPRGLAIGIAGAPDELPGPGDVVRLPWSVCSMPARGVDSSRPYTETSLGGARPDPISATSPLPADSALLVAIPDGSEWLIWHDHRLEIGNKSADRPVAQPEAVVQQIYTTGQQPAQVTEAWLDSIDTGPRLVAPGTQGTAGKPGVPVGGQSTKVGQVVEVDTPGAQTYYLVGESSLRSLSVVQARMAQAYYSAAAGDPLKAHQTDIGGTKTDPSLGDQGLPQTPPPLLPTSGLALCTDFTDPQGQLPGHVLTAPVQPAKLQRVAASTPVPVEGPDTGLADVSDLSAGRCAVVRAVNGDKTTPGALYLITATSGYAVKYPVPDQATLDALGFKGVTPLSVPQSLVNLLHTGPRLAAADAWGQVPPPGRGNSSSTSAATTQ